MEAINMMLQQHILLAEDDSDLRELLQLVLEQSGYRVTGCSNGLELMEQLEAMANFDLVISDIRMPALTGLEVLESQTMSLNKLPFICMTAFGDEATHAAARRFGATAILDKPFDVDEMITLVQKNLSSMSTLKQLRS